LPWQLFPKQSQRLQHNRPHNGSWAKRLVQKAGIFFQWAWAKIGGKKREKKLGKREKRTTFGSFGRPQKKTKKLGKKMHCPTQITTVPAQLRENGLFSPTVYLFKVLAGKGYLGSLLYLLLAGITMAMVNALKTKCIKCGYSIPLSSEDLRKADSVQCPKCASEWNIMRDEGELFLEPKQKPQ
jgi:predicted RNA-binding Zn-ribbon protein involved in translation (DUF1610 family)